MGYSASKNNPADIDIKDVQDAYECIVQKCKNYVLYYKDVFIF
jgi:hypothetical protein